MTAFTDSHIDQSKSFERIVGQESISRGEFLQDLRTAIVRGEGYAAGGYGYSELHWMYYPLFLNRNPTRTSRMVYELAMTRHAIEESGIFPGEAEFVYNFNEFYVNQIRQLDCVGVMALPKMEAETLRYYQFEGKWIYHMEFFPDKSIPDNPNNCYLPALRGKRLLIVCPFADFLRGRATKETFEGVWSKTGRLWFDPLGVEAIEFPYGIAAETRSRYKNVLVLLEEITKQIARRDFDVALIAAAGLAIPIAAFVKRLGKVAIDLGGPLQAASSVSKANVGTYDPIGETNITMSGGLTCPPLIDPMQTSVVADYGYW